MELLRDLPYRVLDLGEFPGIDLPPEGAVSYAENAIGKARAVAAATGMLALGDDSGLEVDVLGGRPGVLSARYGGEALSDADRCRALLEELRGVPPDRRTARFRCVVAISTPAGTDTTLEGVVEGIVLDAPRGRGGFGYDPLFYCPPLGATFAEAETASKHAVSHRGRAIAQARRLLVEWAEHGRRSSEGPGGQRG
jgi:XTP/dITP diphosphohydrolase